MLKWMILGGTTLLIAAVLLALTAAWDMGSYWAVFGAVLYYMLVKRAFGGYFQRPDGMSSPVAGHGVAESPGALTCRDCGFSSVSRELFAINKGPSGRVTDAYCPSCQLRRAKGSATRQLRYVVIMLIGTSALAWFYPDSAAVWLFIWLAGLYLSMIIFILPHELGHALVGRLLGGRVFTIIVGAGHRLATFHAGNTDIAINKIPIGGLTLVAFRERKRFRLKIFLMLLAGPLVHILVIAVVAFFFEPEVYLRPFGEPGLNIPSLVFFSNALLLALSLTPKRAATQVGTSGSDGMQILKVWKITDREIEDSLPLYYTHEGLRCLHGGRLEEALAWYKKGLARFPDNHSNVNDMGLYHLYRGEFAEARSLFRRAAGLLGDKSVQAYPILINNLAYTDLLIGDEGALDEAGRLTEEAFGLAGWMPNIKNTRGMYLFESGDAESGMRLMREAMEEAYDPHSMASSASHLAVAYAKEGQADTARDYLDTARRLDPNNPVIPYAEERTRG